MSLKGLFLDPCYFYDLPNFSESLTFYLFADDTNICCACKNLIDLELKLYHELIAVAGWMKSKRLALSILKTNCIVFPSKKMKPYKTFNLTINGANIQQFSTIKYRGISFDANLTCKSHNDRLCLFI